MQFVFLVSITSKIKRLTQFISNKIKKPLTVASGRGHTVEKGRLTAVSGKNRAVRYAAGGIPGIGPA